MMRAKPKSASHVSTTASPLDDSDRAAIRDLLIGHRLPPERVEEFVKRINGAIAQAYLLEPKLPTRGERQKWFSSVRDAIKPVIGLLDAASPHTSGDIEFWTSEDLEALDKALHQHFGRVQEPEAGGVTMSVLKSLVSTCDQQISSLGHAKKGDGDRQRLANYLARDWHYCFGKMPTASASESRDKECLSPFVDLIRYLDRLYSNRQTTMDSCRQAAQRAIEYAKNQVFLESKYADK